MLFSDLFLGWKYAKSDNMVLFYESYFKRLPSGSEVSRSFRNILWKDVLVRIRSNYYFFFTIFFNVY